MTSCDAPHVVRSAVSSRMVASQRSELAADPVWRELGRLAYDHGFTHWSYVAAPTCSPASSLGEALRITAYPRAHVEACERHGLFSSVPSLAHAFRSSEPTSYTVVRDSAPRSKGLAAFSELNQRFGLSRGILIPLTRALGVRAALGLAFDGSDRELEIFWHDRRDAVVAGSRRLHHAIQSRHMDSFCHGLIPNLSVRKRDVLRALANGCTTTEAADELGVSVFTIDKHVADLKRLLRAGTTAHLTALAVRYDMLDPHRDAKR